MRTVRLIIAVTLLSALALAAVARSSNCTSASATCTFGGATTGDLQIVQAFSGATLPTLPSGWTSLGSATNSPNTIIGCHVASSGSDTASTWTNATRVIGLSYSGTGAVNATCNTTGIGGSSILSFTASGTTYTFSAISMTSGDWVAGFSNANNGTPCATTTNLTGTAITVGASSQRGAANDSNGGISSFSSQTCTGTTGTGHYTTVLEIKTAGVSSFVNSPASQIF